MSMRRLSGNRPAQVDSLSRTKRRIEHSENEEDDFVETSASAKRRRLTIDKEAEIYHLDEDEAGTKLAVTPSQNSRRRGRTVKKPNLNRSNDSGPSSEELPPAYPGLRFPFPWGNLKALQLREIVRATLGMRFVGDKDRAILRLNQVQTEGLDKAIEAENQYQRDNPITSAKARLQETTPTNIRRSKRKRAFRRESLEHMLAGGDDDGVSDDHSASESAVSTPVQIQRAIPEDSANTLRPQRERVVGHLAFQEDAVVTGYNTPDDIYYSAWSPMSKPVTRSTESFVLLPPTNRGNSRDREDAILSPNVFGQISGGYNVGQSSTWTNSGRSEALSSQNGFDDIVQLLPAIIEPPRGSKQYNRIASVILYEVSVNPNLQMAINAGTPDMKEELIRVMLQNRKPAMLLMEAKC